MLEEDILAIKFISFSVLIKIALSLLLKFEFQDPTESQINNISIIKNPVLNNHIFVYFIIYYFGYIITNIFFQFIYSRCKRKNQADIDLSLNLDNRENNTNANSIQNSDIITEKNKWKKYLIFPFYIFSQMIIFYFNQKNYSNISFWMLEFIIIYIFRKKFLEKEPTLYKHEKCGLFFFIFGLGFIIKFISSFFPQCSFENKDLSLIEKMPDSEQKQKLIKIIEEINEKGNRACKNSYNVLTESEYLWLFVIIAIIAYLIGFFFHSGSMVYSEYLIKKEKISENKLIFLTGVFGLSLNIILLFISSFISCGSSENSNIKIIREFCFSVEFISFIPQKYKLYFDNFKNYFTDLKEALGIINNENEGISGKEKIHGILELIVTILLPVLSFSKVKLEFMLIKEKNAYYLLFPEVIYHLFKEIFIISYKSVEDKIDYVQIIQFSFILTSIIFILFGMLVYLEIIVLKFCGLDKDVKKNISSRAEDEVNDNEDVSILRDSRIENDD